jgi:hypothetical protein
MTSFTTREHSAIAIAFSNCDLLVTRPSRNSDEAQPVALAKIVVHENRHL